MGPSLGACMIVAVFIDRMGSGHGDTSVERGWGTLVEIFWLLEFLRRKWKVIWYFCWMMDRTSSGESHSQRGKSTGPLASEIDCPVTIES